MNVVWTVNEKQGFSTQQAAKSGETNRVQSSGMNTCSLRYGRSDSEHLSPRCFNAVSRDLQQFYTAFYESDLFQLDWAIFGCYTRYIGMRRL
jgi:hypothetical protein